jgi:hypothetical protein
MSGLMFLFAGIGVSAPDELSALILFFKTYSPAYHTGWRTKIGEFWSTELRRIGINHPPRCFVILIEIRSSGSQNRFSYWRVPLAFTP